MVASHLLTGAFFLLSTPRPTTRARYAYGRARQSVACHVCVAVRGEDVSGEGSNGVRHYWATAMWTGCKCKMRERCNTSSRLTCHRDVVKIWSLYVGRGVGGGCEKLKPILRLQGAGDNLCVTSRLRKRCFFFPRFFSGANGRDNHRGGRSIG